MADTERYQPQLYFETSGYTPGGWRERPQIVHDEYEIKGFFGPYRWLSNFGKATVMLDGVVYGSVERAYQAAKWPSDARDYFVDCNNSKAIMYNRDHLLTGHMLDEWDAVKVDIMARLLVQKFDPEQNPDNYQLLIETGERYLEEANWWGDTFWGKNLEGEGENTLGQLLMAIRSALTSVAIRKSVG